MAEHEAPLALQVHHRSVKVAPAGARALVLVAAALGVTCWLVYCWKLALTVPAGPDVFDFANNLLYANDMLHGNWFLQGWVVTQDPHWLTDDVVYVLGLWVRGFDPMLLHAEPLIAYTVLVALAAYAAGVGLRLGLSERLIVAAIAILPLVFPSSVLASQVLVGPYHTGTTALALGAILALRPREEWAARGAARVALPLAGGILLAIGRIGDPYMLSLGIVPTILVTLYMRFVSSQPHRGVGVWVPLWAACAAWLAAIGSLSAVYFLGGFTMRTSLAPFIPFSEVGQRLLSFVRSFLDLSGGNIFGMFLGSHLMFALVRLAYLCAAVTAVARVVGLLRKGLEKDWTTAVLTIAILCSAAGTFLYGPNDYLGDEHRTPIFLLLGIVFARHLAGRYRQWLEDPSKRRPVAAGMLCGAVLFAPTAVDQFLQPQGFDDASHFPQMVLARWLEQHRLFHGYGPYDSSSIITVETRNRVAVRPLISSGAYVQWQRSVRTLVPNVEIMADSAWYAPDRPSTFLIVDNQDVDARTARQTFGSPDHVYRVARFQVYVWDKGILCTVPRQVPEVRAQERAGVPPRGAVCRRLN